MHTLISFATQWGSKYGGINCFNTDFLSAFGVAYHLSSQVICIVASATREEIEEARNAHVTLVPLPYTPEDKLFSQAHAKAGIDALKHREIPFEHPSTVWLGHDRITGAAANEAAKLAGGHSALVHHMSYDHYESYAENSATAKTKLEEQKTLFRQADIVLAVGPLLRDALKDLLATPKTVHMLIPGLAEIPLREAPKTFTAFLSGRLNDDAARIKQSYLGVAAFAQAHREACDDDMPDGLCKEPKLVLRGVDFEDQPTHSSLQPENELKLFAEEYANRVINLHALPYTQDRKMLYADLSGASVAMMPSWHEGFGLVAWEAIAAGVPLIISENSGVYRLLEENHLGDGTGCVHPIDVRGSGISPFFRPEDLQAMVSKLKEIAHKPEKARSKAGKLRGILENYTWPACAEQAAHAFKWSLQKGILPPATPEQMSTVLNASMAATLQPITPSTSPLQLPAKQWKADSGMADSQLLRAEEALVPFDPARQPDLDALNNWLDNQQWPQAVRLITGSGGLGKTRLALELCEQRSTAGWHAGLLDAIFEPRDMPASWLALRHLAKPLLIVIDYAETRQPVLFALIKTIQQHPGNHPVRILLLARDGGEWWDNLPSKDPQCEALLSGYATTGPYTLPPLYDEENDRRHAYRQALHTFAQALGVSAPDVDPELAGDHFGRPLYLQMAALLALHGERPTTAEGLTKALLNHERRYWSGLLAHFTFSEPEHYAQQLLALTTLAGGFATSKDAQAYWAKTGETSLSNSDFTSLFKTLVPLYPGKQGLQAVRPDLLGEALVAHTLLRSDATSLLDAVLSNTATQSIRRHTLTVLARLSAQRPDLHEKLADTLARHFAQCSQEIVAVSKETISLLPSFAEAAFERLLPAMKGQVAGLLAPKLLEPSIQLAELFYLVSKYLAEKAHSKLLKKVNNIDCIREYAIDLGNYSVALSSTGRALEAQANAFEVVKLFERLHDKDRKRFQSNYSIALVNYAGYLGNAGHYKDALAYDLKALEIRKILLKENSDKARRDYVVSLQNYGLHLIENGQEDEAHNPIKEALNISQRLSATNLEEYGPVHADSLAFYATYLSAVGEYNDALLRFESALDILKECVKNKPDRYEPDYAESLLNFAVTLCEAGRYEEALKHNYLSKEINQRMAQRNPARYSYGLFCCNCYQHFLKWLSNPSDTDDYMANIKSIPMAQLSQQYSHMQLYSSFLHACRVADQSARCIAFKQVLSICSKLSKMDTRVKLYWFCTIAWLNTFEPVAVRGLDWQADWHRYSNKQKGRIPHWMQEVARRLEFQWPA